MLLSSLTHVVLWFHACAAFHCQNGDVLEENYFVTRSSPYHTITKSRGSTAWQNKCYIYPASFLLGKFPTYSRFSSRQVACKIGWEPFWHAKNNLVNRHQEVRLGPTPHPPLPPSVGKVSHIFPFFFTICGMQAWLGALKLRSSAQIDHISPPPYCKICFSTSESFWHAKNNLVNRHQEVGIIPT